MAGPRKALQALLKPLTANLEAVSVKELHRRLETQTQATVSRRWVRAEVDAWLLKLSSTRGGSSYAVSAGAVAATRRPEPTGYVRLASDVDMDEERELRRLEAGSAEMEEVVVRDDPGNERPALRHKKQAAVKRELESFQVAMPSMVAREYTQKVRKVTNLTRAGGPATAAARTCACTLSPRVRAHGHRLTATLDGLVQPSGLVRQGCDRGAATAAGGELRLFLPYRVRGHV